MLDATFLNEVLSTARDAAKLAGGIIRDQYVKPRQITEKGPRDLVTDTDRMAQDAILALIHERHPEHGFLAEEDISTHSTHEGEWRIPNGVLWVVDPLDGTTNFTTGLPLSCVSIGVAVDGRCVAGVIYDPYRDELFAAAKGMGASLNGEPLPALRYVPLTRAVIAVDWAHHPSIRTRAVTMVDRLAPQCQTVRALGTAALAQAYLASGRVQLYFNFGLQPWDVAAGAVLISEAGGIIQQPNGEEWKLGLPALFAAHPALLAEIQPMTSNV